MEPRRSWSRGELARDAPFARSQASTRTSPRAASTASRWTRSRGSARSGAGSGEGLESCRATSARSGVGMATPSGRTPIPRSGDDESGAMEASVGEHFRGNRCINCMCHSSENLCAAAARLAAPRHFRDTSETPPRYHYRETSLLRAADDFYPDEPAAQPVHLAHVSYNSLFLGEIGHVDLISN